LLPPFDKYRNAFAVYKSTQRMEETFKAGTSYRGHIRRVISNEFRPNDISRITGPFDLAGRWNLYRNFYISSQKEQQPNQFKPIDTLFEAKLWFFGEWPRTSAAHDVKLFIDGKLIWSLAGELVCSGKESWKGHLSPSSFQWSQQPDHVLLSEILSAETCYVDISSRNMHTADKFIKVELYVDGNISPSEAYLVGISDDSLTVMGRTDYNLNDWVIEKKMTLVPNKTKQYTILTDNKYRSTQQAVFSAGARLCETTTKEMCGPWSYANSGTPGSIGHAEVIRISNTKVRINLMGITSHGGVPFTGVIVQTTSCPKSGCVFSTQRIYTSNVSSFEVEVEATSTPIKFKVQICNHLEISHGCGIAYSIWNYPKPWRTEVKDSNVVATLMEGNSLVTGNMQVKSTWVQDISSFVEANERTTTWSHKLDSSTSNTINAWVGCFNATVPGTIASSSFYDLNTDFSGTTEGCALACQSHNYFYSVLADSECKCTQFFPTEIYERQVADVECGAVCHNEENLVPIRYCGTSTATAIWRRELLAFQTRKFTLLVGIRIHNSESSGSSGSSGSSSDSSDSSHSSGTFLPSAPFPCTNVGYVVFSKEQMRRRIGIVWSKEFHDHFACISYSRTRRLWQIDLGPATKVFVPRDSDIIVAIVSSSVDVPTMTEGLSATMHIPSIHLGYEEGDITIISSTGCRMPDSYLQVRCFSVDGYGFSRNKPSILGGRQTYAGDPSTTVDNTIQPYQSSMGDPINELVDMIGPIPYDVTTEVCSILGNSEDFLPLCSELQTTTARALQNPPHDPGRPVFKHMQRVLEGVNVHFVEASWRPPLFWGMNAMSANTTRGIEYQIVKVGNNSKCTVDDDKPALDLCQYNQMYVPSNEQSMLERKNCRLGATDDQLILPSCSCGSTMCNGAVLALDVVPTARVVLGDLYEESYYRIRVRSTVHHHTNSISKSSSKSSSKSELFDSDLIKLHNLVDVITTNAFQNSTWTQWSEPILSQASSLPSRPPQPFVLEAGYTSVTFRIFRSAWHGSPITQYNFLMAKDTACGDLSNLVWDEVDPVVVPTNSTFSPYIDFLRGDPNKGGIGAALENGLYHFKVSAVNKNGEGNFRCVVEYMYIRQLEVRRVTSLTRFVLICCLWFETGPLLLFVWWVWSFFSLLHPSLFLQ
jgi:hypothetical protein